MSQQVDAVSPLPVVPMSLPSQSDGQLVSDLYASGGKGSLRYVFLHGNHAPTHHQETNIEGKVTLFNGQGEIVFEENPGRPSARYRFADGSCVAVDDQPCPYLPARKFVETLLRNVSVPALLVVEVPKDEAKLSSESDDFLYLSLLVLGRSDLDPISTADRTYLEEMSHSFVQNFVTAMARESDSFLPGDAHNLAHEIAGWIMTTAAGESSLHAFLDLSMQKAISTHRSLTINLLDRCTTRVSQVDDTGWHQSANQGDISGAPPERGPISAIAVQIQPFMGWVMFMKMTARTRIWPLCHGVAYVKGQASGRLMASPLELSFWGGVDPQTGQVIDQHHPLRGQFLQDRILAIPGGRGSCSGSGVMLELLLNNKGPGAVLFERREDILTLGVMIAEEIFKKAIPVVVLNPGDFPQLLRLDGKLMSVVGGDIFHYELPETIQNNSHSDQAMTFPKIHLSEVDKKLVQGEYGEAARVAMRIVLRMAELLGARDLIHVTQVHVDGCIYTGPGSLLFAERLRDLGGKVRVPTSLNSISVDQRRWRAQGVDAAFGQAAEKLARAYTDMGARPTFTCSPYQLDSAPKVGDQVAWAESNAVVYANSVLGARTMKYPDFLDIAIALTGRAPNGGPHVDQNRQASLIVRMPEAQELEDVDDSFYPLLGYHVGTLASNQIPVIVGLKLLAPSRDDLKAFGAAFATVSSAPMFHMVGVTPEAKTLDAVIRPGSDPRSVDVRIKDLIPCWNTLNSAVGLQSVDLVSLGNPHFSLTEIRRLAALCRGRTKQDDITVVVTCGRATYGLACQAGLVEELEMFGVQFVTDTCWCMITEPIIPPSTHAIMTNSGKYAHYGPGLTGRKFYFGSLAQCVDAACGGSPADRPRWL
ncbi:DUF521-domain-containing protein [Aspergillus ibericus CBS 121593]|uniref:DUF521-domain-containing protein n=1 Tax=Aspergillus ibericus CBS 121593 TaxID=1448316 RepID=A0A395GZ72_9EURO|nr:DUF521-domain-containing protein [Aspergillus ibericus CBS 121593]RAK99323.1 DUF521-domain-containing protein [Aspergillus ibericus CBS 121593]